VAFALGDPTSATKVDSGWLALGVPLLLASIGAAWKFAGLRADMVEKWRTRVGIARAGLAEKTAVALRTLQRQTSLLLGTVEFDPLAVTHDPADLRGSVGEVVRLLRHLDRLEPRFKTLLRLGPWLLGSVVAFGVGTVLLFGELGGVFNLGWPVAVGLCALVISGGSLAAGFVLYAVIHHRLSVAETESTLPERG